MKKIISHHNDHDAKLSDEFKWERTKKAITPYVLIAPAMIFIVLFSIYPIFKLIRLSFFEYNFVKSEKFIGWRNYQELLFIRDDFWNALKHTVNYTAGTIVFTISLAVLFALWLQKDTLINRFSQIAIFTPHLIAMFSCGMIWAWIMSDTGILNSALNAVGLGGKKWLNSSDTALSSLVIVSVWKGLGYYALVVLSALKSIPAEIFEAVELDDTKPIKKLFRITLPLLSPQVFFLLITITISSFKAFDIVKVMTAGGPGNATDVLTYFIYRYSFMLFKLGYASAAACLFLIIIGFLTIIYFRVLEKKVYYQ